MGSLVMKAKRKRSFNVATFLATVDGGRTLSTYRKNQTVFSQGDPADSVFYIQEGKVKVCVVSERGKEAVVAIHGKKEFFGEGCLSGQPRRLATVAAMTECVIMRLDKAAIVRVLHDEPQFSEMFMAYLLARNARVEEDLVDQLFNSSEKRLARLLLLMANFGKEGRPEPVIAKISQETLAEMIGTTRSRVSAFMNKFRKLGFIEYNGHLEVHNSLLSMVLHETPEIRRGQDAGEGD
jgi:CRP/FNR family cyclic AMP-dependent transcriptional regulator